MHLDVGMRRETPSWSKTGHPHGGVHIGTCAEDTCAYLGVYYVILTLKLHVANPLQHPRD